MDFKCSETVETESIFMLKSPLVVYQCVFNECADLVECFLVMLLCCFSIVVLIKVKQKEETSVFQTQIQQERSRGMRTNKY